MPPARPRNLRNSGRSGGRSAGDWDDVVDPQPPAAGSVGAGETDVDISDLLTYRKAQHRRQRGIGAEVLARSERKGRQTKRPHGSNSSGSAAPQDDGDDSNKGDGDGDGDGSSKAKKPALARSLEGAFTAQTNRLDANKHMMAYIESEMRRRQHDNGGDGCGEGNATGAPGPAGTDDLYQVPQHLRVVDDRPLAEGNVAMATKMLTSIQEVDLGAGSKARAARATEQALERQSHRPGDDGSGAPDQPPGGAWFRRQHDGPSRSGRASDDAALQRFKKHMRR